MGSDDRGEAAELEEPTGEGVLRTFLNADVRGLHALHADPG